MPKIDRPAHEGEKSLSVAFIGLAGVFFGGTVGALPSIVTNVDGAGGKVSFFICILILLFLVLSIIFGGRGFAYGPKWSGFWNRFNLQVICGLIAMMLAGGLGAVIYTFPARQDGNRIYLDISEWSEKLDGLSEKTQSLGEDMSMVIEDIAKIKDSISGLRNINHTTEER